MNDDALAPEDGENDALATNQTVVVDWRERRQPTFGVVDALTTATGRDATEIPPLQNYIDTDALDSLVAGDAPGRAADVTVSFEFDGHFVTVCSDGRVEVTP